MADGNIIEQAVRHQLTISEFFELKDEINGLSVGELREKFAVLEESLDEDNPTCNYVEIDAGDYKCISMVYVDFDDEWKNAEVSFENVTVYNEDPSKGSYQINMWQHLQETAEVAMKNMCDWLVEHGAETANVSHEDGKVSGIEFSLRASDGQERIFFADFSQENICLVADEESWDEWLEKELKELCDGYDVDDEVFILEKYAREMGVRAVLESCEEIDKKLSDLFYGI